MKALQEYLAIKFKMKDLDQLKYFFKDQSCKIKTRNFLVTKNMRAKIF